MSDQLAGKSSLPTRVSSTRLALHLEDGLSYDEWARVGQHLSVWLDSSSWWIGDWLAFGEQAYGNRYKQAIKATGFEYQTLRNYAWVAKRFPVSRRREALSFGHHAEVAALPEEEQDAWLLRCLAERWTRNELRRHLRDRRTVGSGAVQVLPPVQQLALTVPVPRRERWEAAASMEGRPLGEWVADVLDRAAARALDINRQLAAAS